MEPQPLVLGPPVEELVCPCGADVDPGSGSEVFAAAIPATLGRTGFAASLTLADGDDLVPGLAFRHGRRLR
jgi:hypothetical protein